MNERGKELQFASLTPSFASVGVASVAGAGAEGCVPSAGAVGAEAGGSAGWTSSDLVAASVVSALKFAFVF
jgi:uncharacterized protein YraI